MQPGLSATGIPVPWDHTVATVPSGRGIDIPALTIAEAGTECSDPEGMQGWVDLGTGASAQPVPNSPRWDSNPGPLIPQSDALTH